MEPFLLLARHFSQINSLSASPTKWSNTLKQFVGKKPMNCLSLFDHFERLARKELISLRMETLAPCVKTLQS